jgi:hypothetical protein
MTEQLSSKQIQAVALILYGWKSVVIAENLDITPQTLSKWKNESAFKAILNLNKLAILHTARETLQVYAEKAVNGLVNIATEGDSEEVRRKACLNVIQLVGLSDPAKGLFAWGIGATTVQGVIEEELRDQYISDLTTPEFILQHRQERAEESDSSS